MFGKQKTLIIDHNSERNNRIKNYLNQDHFICYQAKTLDEFNSLYTNNNYDCIILEDVFPGINTNKFLVKNRRNSQAITIVISDMLNEAYLEDLLDAGADDYIVVPFSLTSLLRKIQDVYKMGVLRPRKIYRFKDIILDDTAKTVSLNDHSVTLTKNEFKLLKMLMSHPYQPYTSTKIFEGIWGDSVYADDQSVMNIVSSLIIKLNRTGSHEEYIRRFGANSYKMAI